MSGIPGFHKINSAVVEIQNMKAAKIEAQAEIDKCRVNIASEKAMLDSLIAQPMNAENSEYLKLTKRASRAGIKAWKLSIVACQIDVDEYTEKIDDILKRMPEARIDN